MRNAAQSTVGFLAAALLAALAPLAAYADGNDNAEACAEIVEDHAEAIRQCTLAIESGDLSRPDLSMAYANRSYENTVVGNYEAARLDALRAGEIDPANSLADANLGFALSSAGDLTGAAAAYEDAVETHYAHGSRDATVGFGSLLASLMSLARIYDQLGKDQLAERNAVALFDASGGDPRFQDIFDRHGL